jgi:glutaredoxin-related protein
VPGVEALLPRFRAAHTQVLGVSIDSIHCHANWARDLGGVSFPLLADFQPKGAVAQSYGLYLADAGITDRGTVLIDSSGSARHASSVTPAGQRDIGDLAALCEQVDREAGTPTQPAPEPRGLGSDAVLYVKNHCGFSRRTRVAVDNVHARSLAVRNASDDPQALDALRAASGAETAPCLVIDGEPLSESDLIVRTLAERLAPIR